MKTLLFIFFSSLFLCEGFSQEIQSNQSGAQIQFLSLIYDYGVVKRGGDGRGSFKYINTGTQPLLISSVKSSCGCLVPNWNRNPVNPGDTGIISCRYDTKRIGSINKSLTVVSNSVQHPRQVLRIKGMIYKDLVELEQSEFLFNLGTIPFNEFETVTLTLKSKDSTQKIFSNKYSQKFSPNSNPMSDMTVITTVNKSDSEKAIEITLSNLLGNVGEKTILIEIPYNNKTPIYVTLVVNFKGFPGNRIFNTIDSSGYKVTKKTFYYQENKIQKIVTEEKRKYNKNTSSRISEIKHYRNGVCTSKEKLLYYGNKCYRRKYKMERNQFIFLGQEITEDY